MPARRNPTPSCLLHQQSGRARGVWTDVAGVRHQKLLPGRFDAPESRTAFARLQLELEASPAAAVADPAGITVVEVLAAHLDHAARHYRRADGTPTHEMVEYQLVYCVVRELYGHTPATEFGPLALKAVRAAMLARDWCRSLVNQRVGRVRRIFKWAAGEELIPFEVYHRLTAVTGLQKGRTAARDRARRSRRGRGGRCDAPPLEPARRRDGRVPAADRVPARRGVPAPLQCGHGSDAVETAVVVAEEYERLKRASMRPRQ